MEEIKMFKQTTWEKKTIFEESTPGRIGFQMEELSEKEKKLINDAKLKISSEIMRSTPLELPELSELDVIRHFTRLSQMNYGVDEGPIFLGSCTMKYNPKICDLVTTYPEAQNIHPYQSPGTIQGSLQIMYELANWLEELSGMTKVTLQPAAGAHGEYTGMMIIRQYHKLNGNLDLKNEK